MKCIAPKNKFMNLPIQSVFFQLNDRVNVLNHTKKFCLRFILIIFLSCSKSTFKTYWYWCWRIELKFGVISDSDTKIWRWFIYVSCESRMNTYIYKVLYKYNHTENPVPKLAFAVPNKSEHTHITYFNHVVHTQSKWETLYTFFSLINLTFSIAM